MQNFAQQPTNTVCPVCGEVVVLTIQPVIARHSDADPDVDGDAVLRIGTCSAECRVTVIDAPAYFFAAAAENQVAVGG